MKINQHEEIPIALNALYIMRSPNEALEIFSGAGAITLVSGSELKGWVKLSQHWLPVEGIFLEFSITSGAIGDQNQSWVNAALELDGFPEKYILPDLTTEENHILRGRVYKCVDNQITSHSMTSVKFHLVNWRRIRGSAVQLGTNAIAGRLELKTDEWIIVIDPVENQDAIVQEIEWTGGYGITHVGKITRSDGTSFSFGDVNNLLESLYRFLSFARGANNCPVLVTGLNEQGEVVWRQFDSLSSDPWYKNDGWFAHQFGNALVELWPNFIAKWKDQEWTITLQRAIWWYVGAAKMVGGADGGLVLAYSALEILAFAWDPPTNGQKRKTSEKIGELISEMKLILEIPKSFSELLNLAPKLIKETESTNGPRAVTDVRNALVHPKDYEKLTSDGINQAYKLAMHYTELAILYLCEFRGEYFDRTDENKRNSQRVPWEVEDNIN